MLTESFMESVISRKAQETRLDCGSERSLVIGKITPIVLYRNKINLGDLDTHTFPNEYYTPSSGTQRIKRKFKNYL